MGFTVGHVAGLNTDSEFKTYARLLRQRGIDLGKLPRAPEPGTGRRWLYVWNSRADAERFSEEINSQSSAGTWKVMEVTAPSSEGPMGPIIVQVGRRATGLVLALHPLSRTMIQSAFPEAKVMPTTVSINFDTMSDFLTTYGGIDAIAREVVPALSGLSDAELTDLGYALIEDDTERTLYFAPPAALVQN